MYKSYINNITMAASKKLKVVLFLGTVRDKRVGIRVATFMKKQLEDSNHDVDLFDPLEMPFELLKKTVFMYSDRSQAPPWLVTAEQKVKDADAFVMVTGEYNHSIPPALSNMLDHFGTSCYGYRPSGIVSYSPGIFGGMRAAMQLRAMLGELGCLSVSNIFGIPEVHKAIDENGNALNDHMTKGAMKLITQLDWHAWAMKNHRDHVGVPK